MPGGRTLVIVYDLDSGVLPKLKDYASTGFAPVSGSCNLYVLTNSPIGMKKEWKRFIKDLGIPIRFMNRNEFTSEFGTDLTSFPAILIQTGKTLSRFISTEEINPCRELEDLIHLVQQRVAEIR